METTEAKGTKLMSVKLIDLIQVFYTYTEDELRHARFDLKAKIKDAMERDIMEAFRIRRREVYPHQYPPEKIMLTAVKFTEERIPNGNAPAPYYHHELIRLIGTAYVYLQTEVYVEGEVYLQTPLYQ